MTARSAPFGRDMSTLQTVSFLVRRFEEAGIRPDTRRGQNFLIDFNLLRLLVDAAGLSKEDVVLEVGTGLGSLTAMLADRAAAVVTVEVDRRLQQLAAEQLARFDNVTMLCQDALRNKNNLHPNLIHAVREALWQTGGLRYKLVSNLPYSIATPVLANLLSAEESPSSLTVTIQKELADRITAKPATKDYGALSIWIQSQCETRVLRVLPPAVFWPRPKVHSAIVHIVPDTARRGRIRDRAFFHTFVRTVFLHRRKLLRNVLGDASRKQLSKSDVDRLLAERGLGSQTRAEQIDVDSMLALWESIRKLAVFPNEQPDAARNHG
jgi:16S rRNA (adenine1518-N6/adenine1519-N6)-dimethyltransferase